MTTQAHGFGTIYWDGRRWIAAVDLPRQRDEPRRRRRFSGTTREAVTAKLNAYRAQHPAPDHLGRAEYMDRANALGTHTEAEWWALVRSVKKRCHYCGITTEPVWTDAQDPRHTQKDHLIPVSRGGSNAITNVVVSCAGCNAEKGTMTADEYLAWKAAV